MKRMMPLLMSISLSVCATAQELPTNVKWLYEYKAADGKLPAADVWKSTYVEGYAAIQNDALTLNHTDPKQGYQVFSLKDIAQICEEPKGDPFCTFRVSCKEPPATAQTTDFPGFFGASVFCKLSGEGQFGMSTMVSNKQILCNLKQRLNLPKQLEYNEFHDFAVLLKRSQARVHVWMDGAYLGSFDAKISLGLSVSWGDGTGGISVSAAVESIRFGLADVSEKTVYPPGYKAYNENAKVSGIIQNEDCTQYFYTPSFPATRQGLEDYIEKCYLPKHCQIKEFMLNPQSQRASYASKVIPVSWRDMELNENGRMVFNGKELEELTSTAFKRMKSLAESGIDVYEVWIDLLRRHQISPWISIRMNDVHDAHNENSHMHCDLWREHPEFRVAPYRKGNWFAQQLDYGRPEVRDYMMRLVDELLERYDSDGLELDWMRFCRVFQYGHEVENRHILTDFIQTVREKTRQAAERRGHPVKIAVRVQMDPRDAYNVGFDVEEWCRRGLVDIVIPAPFFDNNWEQCPIREWRRIVGKDVLIAPCLDTSYKPYRNFDRTCNSAFENAVATCYLAQGADRIYLFNHFGNQHNTMQTLGALDIASAGVRRHMPLYKDDVAVGTMNAYTLPKSLSSSNEWGAIRMSVGKKPAPGRRAYVIFGSKTAFPEGKQLNVRLNGELISPCELPEEIPFNRIITAAYAWQIPDGKLFDEGNVVEYQNTMGSDVTLDWFEIYIEALP